MRPANSWGLMTDQRTREEAELALLGLRTGDEIVRRAIDGFAEDLTAILRREGEKKAPPKAVRQAA